MRLAQRIERRGLDDDDVITSQPQNFEILHQCRGITIDTATQVFNHNFGQQEDQSMDDQDISLPKTKTNFTYGENAYEEQPNE